MALPRDLFDRLATLRGDIVRRTHGRQRADGGAYDVDRITRAVALGEHVANARALQHRAHAAAGDAARTIGGRLHQHARRAGRALDGVVERVVLQRDVDHLLAGLSHRLADGNRHFARLAEAVANATRTVAHYRERSEAELAATLDDLRRAIDGDELLSELVSALRLIDTCLVYELSLKLETGLARGVSKRLHAAVIAEAGAIERHFRDAGGLGLLRDGAADSLGGVDVAGVLQVRLHGRLHGRRRGQHFRAVRIRHLRIDVARGLVNRQARNTQIADVGAGLHGAANTPLFFSDVHDGQALLLLAFLQHKQHTRKA